MRALQSRLVAIAVFDPAELETIEALARSTAAQSGERRGRVRGGYINGVRDRKVGTVALTMKPTEAACEAERRDSPDVDRSARRIAADLIEDIGELQFVAVPCHIPWLRQIPLELFPRQTKFAVVGIRPPLRVIIGGIPKRHRSD